MSEFKKSRGHGNDETAKIRDLVMPYVKGTVADYGCGQKKIVDHAIGVDISKHGVADLALNMDKPEDRAKGDNQVYDTVYSSHFLEHTKEPLEVLKHWHRVLKDEGMLILYLPDDRWYDNPANNQHLHAWTYPEFLRIIESTGLFFVACSGEHYVPNYAYSFWLVARKIA